MFYDHAIASSAVKGSDGERPAWDFNASGLCRSLDDITNLLNEAWIKKYCNASTSIPISVFNGYEIRLKRYLRPLISSAGTQICSRGMLAIWTGNLLKGYTLTGR